MVGAGENPNRTIQVKELKKKSQTAMEMRD